MAKTFHVESHLPPVAVLPSPEEQGIIRHELEIVMASSPFRGSQQCRSFLEYVVTHTMAGDEGSLKERAIGNAVFGRAADYDTGDDPVVRIRAAEVRKRLAQYYQSLDRPPSVTIHIPSGTYRANFFWEKPAPEEPAEIAAPEEHPAAGSLSTLPDEGKRFPQLPLERGAVRRFPSFWLWLTVGLIAVAICGLAMTRYRRAEPDNLLRTFWEPFLANPKPVVISIGSNAVYRLSDDFADAYSHEHHLEDQGMEFYPTLSPGMTLGETGMHPANDSFVALGDVAAVTEVVAEFTKLHKPFQERFSNDISFAELRSGPTILIGGFNNPMTRELTRNYRFVFASRNRIEDRQQPGRSWVLQASEDSHNTEDYAIVSRVIQDGNVPLISVAGLGQYGTLAATDFVFQPGRIADLGKNANADWRHKNVQLVLRIEVQDFKPVSTSVVATYSW